MENEYNELDERYYTMLVDMEVYERELLNF